MCREGGSRCTKTRGRGWGDLPSAMDLKVSFNQLSDDFFLLCLSPPSLFLSLSKCGNFAVLVDLHILPLGGQDNASWFSPEHRKVREWGCVSVCLCVYVLLRFNRLILQESGIWIYSWGSPYPPSAFIRYMFSLAHAAERLWMIFPPRFNSTCRTSS